MDYIYLLFVGNLALGIGIGWWLARHQARRQDENRKATLNDLQSQSQPVVQALVNDNNECLKRVGNLQNEVDIHRPDLVAQLPVLEKALTTELQGIYTTVERQRALSAKLVELNENAASNPARHELLLKLNVLGSPTVAAVDAPQVTTPTTMVVRDVGTCEATDERRREPRRSYKKMQYVAPYGGKLPGRNDFREVQCWDISSGGVSFFSDKPPTTNMVVITIGDEPALAFVTARVALVQEREGRYLVGCEFLGRLHESLF